jgi:hypothetical protein
LQPSWFISSFPIPLDSLYKLALTPFDDMKYQRLMDGLEVAEVNFSEIDLGDRFDAEYF